MKRNSQGIHSRSDFRLGLLKWFGHCGRDFLWRKQELTPFQTAVTETLLWRTRAESVNKFLRENKRWIFSPDKVLGMQPAKLRKQLSPLGLGRRRARALQAIALAARQRLSAQVFVRDLENVPGAGQYISRATAYVLGVHNSFPVDSNVIRVFERYFSYDFESIRVIRKDDSLFLRRIFPRKDKRLLWAVLDLSALVCKPTPACSKCPVSSGCSYFNASLSTHQ